MYTAPEGEGNLQEHKVRDVSCIWGHVQTLEQNISCAEQGSGFWLPKPTDVAEL
jgi:hypothetical protein